MKNTTLFPYRYKHIGWILLSIGLVCGILLALGYADEIAFFDWKVLSLKLFPERAAFGWERPWVDWITNNWLDELAMLTTILGGLLVAFSKEKSEDEFIGQIRFQSLMWATIVNYTILLLCVVFVYDLSFLNIMIYNMFTILFFFIIRFNWSLYRSKKQMRYEE